MKSRQKDINTVINNEKEGIDPLPGERLEAFVTYTNKSELQFAKYLGYSSATTIYEAEKGQRRISPDLRARLKEKFPELNLSWLLKGTGTMLLTGSPESEKSNEVGEAISEYPQKECNLCKKKNEEIDKLKNQVIEIQDKLIDCLRSQTGIVKTSSG